MKCSACQATDPGPDALWVCPGVRMDVRLCDTCSSRFDRLLDDAAKLILQAMLPDTVKLLQEAKVMGDWVPHPAGNAAACRSCGQAVPLTDNGLMVEHGIGPQGLKPRCAGSGQGREWRHDDAREPICGAVAPYPLSKHVNVWCQLPKGHEGKHKEGASEWST